MTEQLERAIHGLVDDGTLTRQQADRVLERLRPVVGTAPAATLRTTLVEFAGYLGGALLLGGVSLMVVPTWDELPFGARLTLAAVMTLLLAVGAVAARRPWKRDVPAATARLASTLGALAAGGAATTASVVAPDHAETLAGSVAALIVALIAYPLLRGAPALAAAGLASAFTVGSALEQAHVDNQTAWATGFALLGAVWIGLGLSKVVRERGTAGLIGGAIGLVAGEIAAVTERDAVALYGLALGLAFVGAGFGGYLAGRRWPLLVPTVLTALVVPATALANVLDSGLVAGVVVAAVGAAILAAGGVALLRRAPAPRA
jgi:hypothetical protein